MSVPPHVHPTSITDGSCSWCDYWVDEDEIGPAAKIYVASKSKHAPMWRDLRDRGLNIISTWIDFHDDGAILDWAAFWNNCIGEVSRAEVVLAYHEPGDTWKGALVEIGAALGHGKPVVVVGDPDGSWTTHPGVVRRPSVSEALLYFGQDRDGRYRNWGAS